MLARQPIDTTRRVQAYLIKELTDSQETKLNDERARHDEEYKRMCKLHEDAVCLLKLINQYDNINNTI